MEADNIEDVIQTVQVDVDLQDLYPPEISQFTNAPEESTEFSQDTIAFILPFQVSRERITTGVLNQITNPSRHTNNNANSLEDLSGLSRKQRRNHVRAQQRLANNKLLRDTEGPSEYKVTKQASVKFGLPQIIPIQSVQMEDLKFKAALGAYESLSRKSVTSDEIITVEECQRRGYTEVLWDGQQTTTIIDNKDRIFVAIIAKPDPSWDKSLGKAVKAIEEALEKLNFCKKNCFSLERSKRCKECKGLRGEYRAISIGLSFGSGASEPGMLKIKESNVAILKELLAKKDIQRIARSQSSYLAYYFPKLYREYTDELDKLYEWDPSFKRLFSSAFPGATFNFGPQAITYPHYDCKNKGNGVVSLTSMGEFDASKGGHLILITLGIYIRFPAGTTVLFPSAVIEHANTPIQTGEHRMSFTQWAAGGLFRWIDYGFQKIPDCAVTNPALFNEMEKARNSAWEKGIEKFSIYRDLQKDHNTVFDLDKKKTTK